MTTSIAVHLGNDVYVILTYIFENPHPLFVILYQFRNNLVYGYSAVSYRGVKVVYFPYTKGVSSTKIAQTLKRSYQSLIIALV